jgi:hypothetical protein
LCYNGCCGTAKMTPRKKIVCVAVAAMLAIGIGGTFAVVALSLPASVEEKLAAVQRGMTHNEVHEIMGQARPSAGLNHYVRASDAGLIFVWEDECGTARVHFHGDKVSHKEYVPR